MASQASKSNIIMSNNMRYIQVGNNHNTSYTPHPFHYCIHHEPCTDGLTASWVVQNSYWNVQLIAQSPGCNNLFQHTPCDSFKGKNVVFVDICPTIDILNKMLEVCNYILILDHHETNKNMILKLVNGETMPKHLHVLFDMDRAGCQITWDYFNYDTHENKFYPRPWFLDYVGDGDLWYPSEKLSYNHLPDSRLIVKGLVECGHLDSRETIKYLYDTSGDHLNHDHIYSKESIIRDKLIPIGEIFRDKANKAIASIMKRANLMEYTAEDGSRYYVWLVNNSDYTINSDLGHQLLDKPIILSTQTCPKTDVSDSNDVGGDSNIIYHYPGAGIEGLNHAQASTVKLDIDTDANNRSTKQLIMPAFSVIIRGYDPIKNAFMASMRGGAEWSPNVAKICERFGGGGHPAASGATISYQDFKLAFHAIEHN